MSTTPDFFSEGPFISAHLNRKCADGNFIKCDVLIYFEAKYNFYNKQLVFVRVDFDGGMPDDAPGQITDEEIDLLRCWFYQNQDKCADLIYADVSQDYGCWRYHQQDAV